MALAIESLSQITQTQIDDAYNTICQMVAEQYPDVDLTRGVVHDLVIMLSSVLTANNQANMDRIRRSNSITAIQADPTLADNELVDNVASNFFVTRSAAKTATGLLAIVQDELKDVVIPEGSAFTYGDTKVYTADNTYVSRASEDDVVETTDKLLIPLGNNTYLFTITVNADTAGSAYNIAKNSELAIPALDTSVISAYAASTFHGGTDEESNEELVTRLTPGMASRSLYNSPSIEAVVRDLDLASYDSSLAVSVVGFGDEEQDRYNSLIPVAYGGRVDVYVRPNIEAITTQVVKEATFVDNDSGDGIWRVTFGRDEIPGMYEVTRVTLPASITDTDVVGFEITSDTRSYDVSVGTTDGLKYPPDILQGYQAAFSRYQTATIEFKDTITSVSGLTEGVSTADYAFDILYMPGIDTIQDAVANRSIRNVGGDTLLVKAAVPCYLSIVVTISKYTNVASPSVSDIKDSIVSAISLIGFTDRLTTSVLANAIQPLLSGNVFISNILLIGNILGPKLTTYTISSNSALVIPDYPDELITSKTTAFLISKENITVNINTIS